VIDNPRPDFRHNRSDAVGIPQVRFMDIQARNSFEALSAGTSAQKKMHLLPFAGKPPDKSPPHKP
jgi:hypothetical protein